QETESRLADAQQRISDALERAAKRLEEVEARATEAESRAARAERLAKLKTEGIERERRLRTMLDRIAQAEERASEAERRARETVSRIANLGSEPAPPVPKPPAADPGPPPDPEGRLNLNEATYDDLRRLKLSVTQTNRVLEYRDHSGPFESLDELDKIVGFPHAVLTELKRKLTL